MALHLQNFVHTLTKMVAHRPHQRDIANPAVTLAHAYTGTYAFLDEQTNKSHQLSVSPELDIKIDGRSLPGHVTGITTATLTFLDHYGYQLIITNGADGPATVYDEAEDQTYQIVHPHQDATADEEEPAPDED